LGLTGAARAAGMKFGKDLQQYRAPGWEDDYIDYKELKLILKRLEDDDATKDEVDAEFFQALEDNLEKVNRAFLEKCQHLEAVLDQTPVGRERWSAKEPSSRASGGSGGPGTPRHPGTPASLASLSLGPPSSGAADRSGGGVPSPKPARLKATPLGDGREGDAAAAAAEIEAKLAEREFYEAYRMLGRLQTYVWINTKGFQKIMKKYDKRMELRGTAQELGPEFEARLEKEAFCSGKMSILAEMFKSRRPGGVSSSGIAAAGSRPQLQLITGNANSELASEIAARLGVPLTPAKIARFPDGEVSIQILENVRNSDVYIIQPTCPPVNDNLMELLLCASAVRRAAAARVTAVVPYYGYARQDRKERSRVPISAADVAKMMEAMGVDRVCCVDLHCGQIQGFFGPRTPVDNLWATPIAVSYFKTRELNNVAVVSPDAGGVARAKMFREGLEAQGMRASLAMIITQRRSTGELGSEIAQADLVGTVTGCDCIIVDDMIDTAGTLFMATNALKSFGASRVFAFATHGLLFRPGVANSCVCCS